MNKPQAIEISCKYCHKLFTKISNNNKFCSKACNNKFHRPTYNKINNERYKKQITSLCSYKDRARRICLSCDKSFMSYGNFNRVCAECKKMPVFKESVYYV